MKKKFFIFGSVVLIMGVIILVVALFYQKSPANHILSSGRIEGRITTLTPRSSGKVVTIYYDEGQTVKEGSILAILDDDVQRARVQKSAAQLNALKKHLEATNVELKAQEQQVNLRIKQAQAALAAVEARVMRTFASYKQSKRDASRYTSLVKRHLVAKQKAESAVLEELKALHTYKEAVAAKQSTEKSLRLAYLEIKVVKGKKIHRDALLHEIKHAKAALAEQQSYLDNFIIRSPISGTILTRTVELGEYVNVGTPLFTLVNLKQLYVKVYIPEPKIGKIALNQKAQITVNSYPNRYFSARVAEVSQQAEFTPKNVETKEERAKLVFAVKLFLLENPGNVLKPGMPTDARIDISGTVSSGKLKEVT